MSGSGGGLSGVSIDTDSLLRKATLLAVIAANFESGGENIDLLQEGIGRNDSGVRRLGAIIEASADQWSARRRDMKDRISQLEGYVRATATNFDQLDADMAGAIRDQAAPPTTGSTTGSGSSGTTPHGAV